MSRTVPGTDQGHEGNWSIPVKNVIEQGAVRKFADAIGDANPLYRDVDFARHTRRKRVQAPPTFACTLDYGVLAGVSLSEAGLIHGEQSFRFARPLFVGDELWCSQRLEDVTTRTVAGVATTYHVVLQTGVDGDGETVFTARTTVIRRGGGGVS